MTDPFMEQKLARISAGLAISNLGLLGNHVRVREVLDNRCPWTGDEYSEICQLAGHLIESDTMEESFRDEALLWRASLKNKAFLDQCAERNGWVKTILEMTELTPPSKPNPTGDAS